MSHHSDAKQVSDGPVTVSPAGQERTGRHAAYTLTAPFAHRQQALGSELFLFVDGGWFIKYRVSYPASEQATIEPAVKAFIADLNWPAKGKEGL